jgi:predicted membrane chloride channel (bestrophin family)
MIAYDNKAWHHHIFVWKGAVIKGILPRVIIFMAWAALMIYLYDVGIIPGEKKIDMVIYNVVGLAWACCLYSERILPTTVTGKEGNNLEV